MTDKSALKPGTLQHEAKLVQVLEEHAPLIYAKARRNRIPATIPVADRLATHRVNAVESLNKAKKYSIEWLDIIFAPVHGVNHPAVEESSTNE